MSRFAAILLLCITGCNLAGGNPERGEDPITGTQENAYTRSASDHVRTLAADTFEGRRTGTEGNARAARYLADAFQDIGLAAPNGAPDYLQAMTFHELTPARSGSIAFDVELLVVYRNFMVLAGPAVDLEADLVYVGDGTEADFAGLDVTGKVVVALQGYPRVGSPYFVDDARVARARQNGAVALIELTSNGIDWSELVRAYGRVSMRLADPEAALPAPELPLYWVSPAHNGIVAAARAGHRVRIVSSGRPWNRRTSSNVVGILRGATEPETYVAYTAHYDAYGVLSPHLPSASPSDSLYNGAVDNAMGVAAILALAQQTRDHPVPHSSLFIAFTGEEQGLLGSRYYVDHPLVPLNRTAFVFNADNSDLADVATVDLFTDLDSSITSVLVAGAAARGVTLTVRPDIGRSDHVSFKQRGIKTAFLAAAEGPDPEPTYHTVRDDLDHFDFLYQRRYVNGYLGAASALSDRIVSMPE